jgi:ATP-dependent DNA helicase RecG
MMTLREQIAQGENIALEFKEARPKDALKFVKTVVAFANGRGGRLLFGVEDGTGVVKGVDPAIVQREMDAISDTIANVCTPRINPKLMLANVDGKVVIVVDVPQGDSTPYYVRKLGIRKGTFQRVGATTREVEEYALKELILDGENLSFDKQIIKSLKLGKKDVSAACRLMTECARKNCESQERSLDVKAMTATRLVSMGLLADKNGVMRPSYALALIAGWTIPDLMTPKIRCGVFKGVDKTGDFLDHADYEGPLADQIEDAFQFVRRNLRLGSSFVERNTARKDIYELPLVSVREAICNAVFHRNYLEPANIYVALYDDRLEITSPGGLLRDITMDDVKAGYSKVRNRGIAEALVYMHEVENWGGGVARYYARCRELGLREPVVEDCGDRLRVIFYRGTVVNRGVDVVNRVVNHDANVVNRVVNVVNESAVNSSTENAVIDLIGKDSRTTAAKMAASLGLVERTIQRTLKALQIAGKVRRVGGTRGRWEIIV